MEFYEIGPTVSAKRFPVYNINQLNECQEQSVNVNQTNSIKKASAFLPGPNVIKLFMSVFYKCPL